MTVGIVEAAGISEAHLQVELAPLAEWTDYLAAHTASYVDWLRQLHDEPPQEPPSFAAEAVRFERRGVGGTLAGLAAITSGAPGAYHLGGGYHHGHADRPSSIDYSNDVAIAVRTAIGYRMGPILIIDLDAHFPDGCRTILSGDPNVLQVSLHSAAARSIGTGSLDGCIDVGFPPNTTGTEYLRELACALDSASRYFQPRLLVYQAGVDPHVDDPSADLVLDLDALHERDTLVFSRARALDVPVLTVLGGGYGPLAPLAAANTIAAMVGVPRVDAMSSS